MEQLEHIGHMLQFGFAIGIGVENTEVKYSVLPCFGVEIHAVDHPDAVDDTVLVPAVLPPNGLDFEGKNLFKNRVVEDDAARLVNTTWSFTRSQTMRGDSLESFKNR